MSKGVNVTMKCKECGHEMILLQDQRHRGIRIWSCENEDCSHPGGLEYIPIDKLQGDTIA